MPDRRPRDIPSIVMAACAVVVTVLIAFRTFAEAPVNPVDMSSVAPVELRATLWDSIVAEAFAANDATDRVRAVVFADYECPACRGFAMRQLNWSPARRQSLAISTLHFPLEYHRFAVPAARAAECASVAGLRSRMDSVLYSVQDSLGLVGWSELAVRAGVRDSTRFLECLRDSGVDSVIARQKRLGNRAGVAATPTLVVEGWMYRSLPDDRTLDSLLQAFARTGGGRN